MKDAVGGVVGDGDVVYGNDRWLVLGGGLCGSQGVGDRVHTGVLCTVDGMSLVPGGLHRSRSNYCARGGALGPGVLATAGQRLVLVCACSAFC